MVKNASAALLDMFTTKQKEHVLSLLCNASQTLFTIQPQKLASVRDKHHLTKDKNVWLVEFLISGLNKKLLANRVLKDLHLITMKTSVSIRIKLTELTFRTIIISKLTVL